MRTPKSVLLEIEQALTAVSNALSKIDGDEEWNKFSNLQGQVNDGLELITPMLDAYDNEQRESRRGWLEAHGIFVGARNPKRNQAFKGRFMVCEDPELEQATDDAGHGGGYCIVGDNLDQLITDAYNHFNQ